jgi:hypothetical protein
MKEIEILPQGKKSSLDEINNSIESFLGSNDKVLVLSSMDVDVRDYWFLKCFNFSDDYVVERWTHSSRIAKIIEDRIGVEIKSIYQTIYGGIPKSIKEELHHLNQCLLFYHDEVFGFDPIEEEPTIPDLLNEEMLLFNFGKLSFTQFIHLHKSYKGILIFNESIWNNTLCPIFSREWVLAYLLNLKNKSIC